MKRPMVIVLTIAVVHLAVSGVLMGACLAGSMGGTYEHPEPLPILGGASAVTCPAAFMLALPVTVSVDVISAQYGYLAPATLNSLLWAVALYGLYRLGKARRSRRLRR